MACLMFLSGAVIGSLGCESPSVSIPSPATEASKSAGTPPVAEAADEHPHIPGVHGGIIVPIGSDSYHAEAVIEKSGSLRLLMLGKDESRIQEVDLQAIKAYIKSAGDTDATPIDLVATPQDGDTPGKTSQFVGQVPEASLGKALDVTIPNLKIEGERFRFGFTTAIEPSSAEHSKGMPAGVPTEEERELFLTPGGKYTVADIQANGNVVASKKFKGIKSAHDMFPAEGDRICPVTLTKANPKFTWIINSIPYQFCCPPCVDEYVRLAKTNPEHLKAPEQLIK